MKNEVTYIKEIRIIREDNEPDLMGIRAKGIATFKRLIAPVLKAKEYESESPDGIFELDLVLEETYEEFVDADLEVEIVFKIKNLPEWVKGVKINAAENSEIELL